MSMDKIFKNNKEWISKQLELDEKYFENLSKGKEDSGTRLGI